MEDEEINHDQDVDDADLEDDMDVEYDPNDYRPGTLLKIKMVNFMCHDSFELDLGPRVNFVIGPNGSGKSAILTALVVAFGARASVTSRGKKLDEFIKYGQSRARVEVHIHNYKYIREKQFAFKPDEYGRFIILERIIKSSEGAKFILRDEKRHIISERKSELEEMVEWFRIQVDNPIVILNQEVSKCFLHSKKPEDKYNLYMEATLLNKIQNLYSESTVNIGVWKQNCLNKQKSYDSVSREQEECKNKIQYIQESKKIHEQIEKFQCELMWSAHNEKQQFEAKVTQKIKDYDEKLNECTEETSKYEDKIGRYKDEILGLQSEMKIAEEDRKKAQRDIVETRIRVNELRTNSRTIEGQIRKYESEMVMCNRDSAEYEKKLDQLQSQYRDPGTAESDRVRRQKKCELLEKEISDLKAKENTWRTHLRHQQETLSHIRQEVSSAMAEKSDLQQKLKQTGSNLERLTNGKENSLRKFGDYMIELCKQIEHNQSRFKHKPIGPIGNYIQLKNPECALALETCLKGLSYAFACDNLHDMQALTSLFKQRFPGQRPPQMITRRFKARHDISKTRVQSSDYPCFLDLIEVSNPGVFNILVDKANLEHILFVPEYEQAEELMINPNLTPEFCRCAYTKDGCVMYPKTSESGYRSYTNEGRQAMLFDSNVDEHIKRLENEKQQLRNMLVAANQKRESHAARYEAGKAESEKASNSLDETTKEISEKEEMLMELKHVVDDNPTEIRVFEEELANIKNKIDVLTSKISERKASLALVDTEMSRVQTSLSACQDKEQELLTKISEIEKNIFGQQRLIEDRQRKLRAIQGKISKFTEERATLEREQVEAIQMLDQSALALENIPKVDKPRPTDQVKRDLDKAKKTISVKESLNQDCFSDPVSAVARLENRIMEIDKLKNHMKKSVTNMKSLHHELKDRKVGYKELTRVTNRMLGLTFAAIMSGMNMQGDLNVYVDDVVDPETQKVVKKARTLEILVNTKNLDQGNKDNGTLQLTNTQHRQSSSTLRNGRESGHMCDTRSLSGGERSYSTVAFIISLWKHCHAPFKVLDEIDVFMDMVTRRISYNALIDFAVSQGERAAQYIFLSPLELPKINDPTHVRVKVMPTPNRDNNNHTVQE